MDDSPNVKCFPRGIPRGLIEARQPNQKRSGPESFPRGIPRGLIEARSMRAGGSGTSGFPRGIPRGLIEAGSSAAWLGEQPDDVFRGVFPAASLKPHEIASLTFPAHAFSAGYSPRPH